MNGEEPLCLVVKVPMAQDQTHHALIDLEVALNLFVETGDGVKSSAEMV